MSIPGKEETGNLSWQSSKFFADIPFKKRKFPLIRPLSPQSQESHCPSAAEAKSLSPSRELFSLNIDTGSCSLGASNAIKSPISDVKQEIIADTHVNLVAVSNNISKGISQAQIPPTHLGSVETKVKPFISGEQNMTDGSKVVSTQVKFSAEPAMKNLPGLPHSNRDCIVELSGKLSNTELSLGPEEPIFSSSTTDLSSKGSSQIPDKLDPSMLCLSLSQNNCASGSEGGDSMVKSASTYVHTKRSNWDLNTPMDAWEGPAGGCNGVGSLKVSCMPDIEPSISGEPKFVSDTGEQFLGVARNILDPPTSSLSHVGKYRSEDSLRLSLSTSALPVFSEKRSIVSAAQVNPGIVFPNLELVSTIKKNSAGCDTVKSEPFDESVNNDNIGARGNFMELSGQVYKGLEENAITKAVNSSNVNVESVNESRSIKFEPVQESKDKQNIAETALEKVILCQDNVSLSLTSCPSGFPTCTKSATSENEPNPLEDTNCIEEAHEDADKTQESCKMGEEAANGLIFSSNISDGMINTGSTDDTNVDNLEKNKLEAKDVSISTSKNSECFESDEENKNILADILEEDVYVSDCVSEGNHETLVNLEVGDERKVVEYEDGEVREAPKSIEADVPVVDMEKEINIHDDVTRKISEPLDMPVDCSNGPAPDTNCSKTDDRGELSDDHTKESGDVALEKATAKVTDGDCSLPETSTVEETTDRVETERHIKTTGRSPPVISGGTEDQIGHDMEELSDGATGGGQDNGTAVCDITTVDIKATDTLEKVDPTLPNTESYFDDKDADNYTNHGAADKDASSGGSRSRIINLAQASNVTSPYKPRFMFSRPLSATERDRHTDFEVERVPVRRNRSDFYAEVPQNFDRNRFHDRSFRNSGTNFVRGRGRGFRQHVEWDSDRDFGAETNYNSGSYHFSRYKGAGDAEFEGNGYSMTTSRSSVMGRGAFHSSSRRLSIGGRDGTGTRGNQMLQRFPRNTDSSRSTGEHNPDFVGLRNSGKFTRGLPKDDDPIFDHPQHVNDVADEQFIEGSRNFSTAQRRGPRRIRSKSPVNCRTHSPSQWSSPRRRSSDNLIGLQELNHRRSPNTYRMDRIRSPDRPCFTEEAIGRRCGSPPYVARPSRDTRNTESGSANSNRRRPFDSVLPESTRRFNITDPRERRDGELFRGLNHSGRFNEFSGERRKYGDRRGLGRSFRPSFNSGGDNFQFNEDGNRPFCVETNSMHIERGDLREREFDRRINYKTANAPNRIRNLEEGGNYRHGGQVWHDDGFDDVPQLKRRKF